MIENEIYDATSTNSWTYSQAPQSSTTPPGYSDEGIPLHSLIHTSPDPAATIRQLDLKGYRYRLVTPWGPIEGGSE